MIFISPQKLFSFSKYLSFCRDFLVMQKKQFDQKDKVNLKIHYVTTWITNNCNAHIADYLRSKSNQTMKLGQLIEYNMRNIFVEKSPTKYGGETMTRPLSKKSKLSISLDQQCKVLNSLFLLYTNLRALQVQRNQAKNHLLLPHIKLF